VHHKHSRVTSGLALSDRQRRR